MKKVLITATVDSHILSFHLPFLKDFKDSGYEVHVATNGTEEIPYCDIRHTISFERSPLNFKNLKAIKQLKKLLEEECFDIVFTNTPMGSVVTRLACKKMRGKKPRVIYMAHGLHFYKGASKKNWFLFYPVEKYLSKFTDTLILINQEDYAFAKKKFKCTDVQYLPGVGIDSKKFNFKLTKEEEQKLRESLKLSKKDFVLIYPAELNKNKNQSLLIEVMSDLIYKYPNIHLLLPGIDSYNGYYQNLVKKMGLDKNIHFLGYRKDIPKLLKISDVSVASSHREGLAVNIMEAMASGLPIVATNVRGQRDLIEDHKNGFIVELNDVSAFSNAIEKLYNDKKLYQKMSRENEQMSKKYQLDIILKEWRKIIYKKKTVMHVLASNKYSGAENVICTIISNTNDEYMHYYCSPDGPIKNTLQERKINFVPLKKLNFFELKKIIKRYNPDIIHAHDFKASCLVSVITNNKKKISHLHQNPLWMKEKGIKAFLYKICSRKFQKIIVVSKAIEQEYTYKNSIAPKCVEITNIVEKDMVIEKAKEKYLKNFDIAFFGRITTEKQPLKLIEIIKEYEQKYEPLNVCFVGGGDLKPQCMAKIKELNLKSTFEFLGFQENPFKIIKNCKCVLMPSLFEGFGLTAVESMLLGCPVLNSGAGGLKKIFGEDSWYICKSMKEYIEKMHVILIQEEIPKVDIEEYTNKEKFATKIKNIYKE